MLIFDRFHVLYQPPGDPFPRDGGAHPVEMVADSLARTFVDYTIGALQALAERDGMPGAITLSQQAEAICRDELGGVPPFLFRIAGRNDLFVVSHAVTPDVDGYFVAAMTPSNATIGVRFFTAQARVN